MIGYILDTDAVSLIQRGNPPLLARILSFPPGEVGISVITVEEQLTGWYTYLRRAKTRSSVALAYERLARTVTELGKLPIAGYREAEIIRYESLKALKLGVGAMDLRIAAVCLEQNATLITRNRRDFSRIPDLAFEDWS